MTILKNNSKFQRDIAKIGSFSSIVEKQMSKIQKSDEAKISKLTFEELQDFNKILQIANYLLCKYEDKKEIHSLLKDFVKMIVSSTNSLDALNDQIDELVISADDAIGRIKELQANVSENFTVDSVLEKKSPEIATKTCGINLTKSTTPVYTQEYQAKSQVETEQVI